MDPTAISFSAWGRRTARSRPWSYKPRHGLGCSSRQRSSSEPTARALVPGGRGAGRVLQKDWLTAVLLSLFVGVLGIDRFYLGYTGLGIVKLITCGGLGIWALIDLILIVMGRLPDVNNLPLRRS